MPVAGTKLTHEETAKILYNAGWHDVIILTKMVATSEAESGLYTEAYHVNDNGTTDWGFLQLNDNGVTGDTLVAFKAMAFNPEAAATHGRSLYVARGFQPWVAYNTGAYLKYMAPASRGVMNFVRILFGIAIY
jgi:hypothetical protein